MEKRKKAKQVKETFFNHLMRQAHKAGMNAANGAKVAPMVVTEDPDMLPAGKKPQTWVVDDGPCGFAWVEIHPANCAFAKWLQVKANTKGGWEGHGLVNGAWGGVDFGIYKGRRGLTLSTHLFNQGITRKAKYCGAFADVLHEEANRRNNQISSSITGIKSVYASSRLD